MASPHGDSFYCLNPQELGHDGLLAYHAITIGSATVGLCGAAHNLRTWNRQLRKREHLTSTTGSGYSGVSASTASGGDLMTHSMGRRRWEQQSVRGETGSRGGDGFVDPEVVLGLAYADAFACVALIIRSIMAFAMKPPVMVYNGNVTTSPLPTTDSQSYDGLELMSSNGTSPSALLYKPYRWWYEVLGGPVEFSILYFYVATYLWTLSYALSVYFNLSDRSMKPRWYRMGCWLGALVPAITSIVARFYPSGVDCASRDTNLYITYSSLYVPILIVMIVNPIIYVKAFGRVSQVLTKTGQVTNQGRQMILAVKYKFLLIVLFFYICWIANIADGIMQFAGSYSRPPLPLWLIEAILNPLQGVFNALIYGRHHLFKTCLMWLSRRRIHEVPTQDRSTEFTESDRLVHTQPSAENSKYYTASVVGT